MELKEFVKELNNLTNDQELKDISKDLQYSISTLTSQNKDKYEFGKKIFLSTKEKYINRISQILEEKFEDKLK